MKASIAATPEVVNANVHCEQMHIWLRTRLSHYEKSLNINFFIKPNFVILEVFYRESIA